MTVREGRTEIKPYWQLTYQPATDRPAEEYAEQLRELLTDATRLRLRAEPFTIPPLLVPLGGLAARRQDRLRTEPPRAIRSRIVRRMIM